MIARHRRGWIPLQSADAYERLLNEKVLPALRSITGYEGDYALRQNQADEVEFVVINFFRSLESVKQFTGTDYTLPIFEPEARVLLSRIGPVAAHCKERARM